MTIPNYYNPSTVGQLVAPQVADAIAAGVNAGLRPATDDETRTILLLIDAQIDFIHPDGNLAVPGAVEDTQRIVEWMYTHMGHITSIAASLDTHYPIQIFYPTWWVDADGNHPEAYTVIPAEDVTNGKWTPVYEKTWSVEYVQKLELEARKQLMIWPYHVLLGTAGHDIVPAIYEAIAYHSAARDAQPQLLVKGTIPKTEHYSIFEPEIKVDDHPQGSVNTEFLEMLASYDYIYLSGQAKSHCVLETTTSLMRYFKDRPEIIAKMRLIEDTTSSVAHPEIDFEALANETYQQYQDQGLMLVSASDPVA